mmetsp:Transcript_62671/g.174657  ORF Transcript_62671/g.174657 Transcript_62671/m.174657 type:complete len:267 (+) Transcript_62671:185-985(+)
MRRAVQAGGRRAGDAAGKKALKVVETRILVGRAPIRPLRGVLRGRTDNGFRELRHLFRLLARISPHRGVVRGRPNNRFPLRVGGQPRDDRSRRVHAGNGMGTLRQFFQRVALRLKHAQIRIVHGRETNMRLRPLCGLVAGRLQHVFIGLQRAPAKTTLGTGIHGAVGRLSGPLGSVWSIATSGHILQQGLKPAKEHVDVPLQGTVKMLLQQVLEFLCEGRSQASLARFSARSAMVVHSRPRPPCSVAYQKTPWQVLQTLTKRVLGE